jgi:glyoxylase-like metal-dependent hydrolase (beta-lactamase superfamily II)
MLRDRYGARVALGEGDWKLIEKGGAMPGGKPKKDMVVRDGGEIVLGDTTVTTILTPGHTPGDYGLLFTAKDRDVQCDGTHIEPLRIRRCVGQIQACGLAAGRPAEPV